MVQATPHHLSHGTGHPTSLPGYRPSHLSQGTGHSPSLTGYGHPHVSWYRLPPISPRVWATPHHLCHGTGHHTSLPGYGQCPSLTGYTPHLSQDIGYPHLSQGMGQPRLFQGRGQPAPPDLSQSLGHSIVSPRVQVTQSSVPRYRPMHHFSWEPTSCAIYHKVNGTKNTRPYSDNFHQTSVAHYSALSHQKSRFIL